MAKPRAAYVAPVSSFTLLCECGGTLEAHGKAFLCNNPGCEWEGRAMLAITMPGVMYEREERTGTAGDWVHRGEG
jgi:hypothetical protein